MKNQNYFSHDSNARNDAKILRLRMKYGAAGYGVYFMILERLREEENYMSVKDYNMIAFDLRVNVNRVKSVVEDFGLFAFTEDGECFYSESFLRRMDIKDNASKVRSAAGKKGLAKRWANKKDIEDNSKVIANAAENDSKVIANVVENDSKVIANVVENDSKKSKEKKVNKENKVKENIKETTPKGVKEKAVPFQTPTIEEIKRYVEEKGYAVDAERFFNFYESKGWMIGKNKMKNWHAAVATWQKADNNQNPYGNNQQRREDRRGETDFSATSWKDYEGPF